MKIFNIVSVLILLLILNGEQLYGNRVAFVHQDENGNKFVEYMYMHGFNDADFDRLLLCFPNALRMQDGDLMFKFTKSDLIQFHEDPNFSVREVEQRKTLENWGCEVFVQETPVIYTKNQKGYITWQYGDTEYTTQNIIWYKVSLVLLIFIMVLYGLVKKSSKIRTEVHNDVLQTGMNSPYLKFIGYFRTKTLITLRSQIVGIGFLTIILYNLIYYLNIFEVTDILFLISVMISLILYTLYRYSQGKVLYFNFVYAFTVVILYLIRHGIFANGLNITWSNLLPMYILLSIGLIGMAVYYIHLKKVMKSFINLT